MYNHWQKSFSTDDPWEAAAGARAQRLVVDWDPERLMKTRYYCSAFEYFPGLDRNLVTFAAGRTRTIPYSDLPGLRTLSGSNSAFTERCIASDTGSISASMN